MQCMTRIEKNDMLRQYNDKFIMCSDRACGIILLSVTASRRQYQNKPRPSNLSPFSPPETIAFIPSGANKQKIKILAHRQYNVRASKNAEQAFSTQ